MKTQRKIFECEPKLTVHDIIRTPQRIEPPEPDEVTAAYERYIQSEPKSSPPRADVPAAASSDFIARFMAGRDKAQRELMRGEHHVGVEASASPVPMAYNQLGNSVLTLDHVQILFPR